MRTETDIECALLYIFGWDMRDWTRNWKKMRITTSTQKAFYYLKITIASSQLAALVGTKNSSALSSETRLTDYTWQFCLWQNADLLDAIPRNDETLALEHF